MNNNWKNWIENTKIIYHGEDTSFLIDNLYAKEKLKVGKAYAVDYTIEDEQYDINNCVCLKEDSIHDWDVALFDTVKDYINKLLEKYEPEFIYICKTDGTVINKFNLIKEVDSLSFNEVSLYNRERMFVGDIYTYNISSVCIDCYENIVIYLDI